MSKKLSSIGANESSNPKDVPPIPQIPFDDALRKILKAPPIHKTAKQPQKKKPA